MSEKKKRVEVTCTTTSPADCSSARRIEVTIVITPSAGEDSKAVRVNANVDEVNLEVSIE